MMVQLAQEKETEKETELQKTSLSSEIYSNLLDRTSFRIALTSIFTSLSIIVGYLLVYLPNIELITMMIFLSGFILGKKEGTLVGAFSSIIFCFFNPMGNSLLLLFSVQLPYYSLVGLIGALTRSYLERKSFFKPNEDLYVFPVLIIFGLLAVIMTTVFQLLADFIGYISSYSLDYPLIFYYLMGLPFSIIHVIGNLLGFVIILPGLIQLLYKLLD